MPAAAAGNGSRRCAWHANCFRRRVREDMNVGFDNLLGLLVAIGLCIYLVYALIRAERF